MAPHVPARAVLPLLAGSGGPACLCVGSVLGLAARRTLQCPQRVFRVSPRRQAHHAVPAQVEQLSERAQAIIGRYAGAAGALAGAHAGMCAVTGMLPWAHPTSQEYEELARVSFCCGWVHGQAVHGHAVVSLSVLRWGASRPAAHTQAW